MDKPLNYRAMYWIALEGYLADLSDVVASRPHRLVDWNKAQIAANGVREMINCLDQIGWADEGAEVPA
jgi:hypothetical protein